MLIGLTIRDVVLVETLELSVGPGLTALTGETGAGKSIILGALALAAGARADGGLVRRGASQASATAVFAPPPESAVWAALREKDLAGEPDEDLVLRRTLSAEGRSRAFVNDQPTSVGVLRELGSMLMESHGQHETVGLLDPRTHRPQLDGFGDCSALGGCLLDAPGKSGERRRPRSRPWSANRRPPGKRARLSPIVSRSSTGYRRSPVRRSPSPRPARSWARPRRP